MSFVQCGCGKIGCQSGIVNHEDHRVYTCPWCGNSGELAAASDNFDVSGVGY
jgi:hypothetical protein